MEKTCRELYNEFCKRFTIDQVADSISLSMIYTYLKERCSHANGNYVHIPPIQLRFMIEKHMGYIYNLSFSIKKESPVLS